MYKNIKENILNTLSLFLLLVVFFVPFFDTLGMQSSNFSINEDSINFGGTENSESENYKISDTLGEIGTGEMEESCYSLELSGSEYADVSTNSMISETEGTISLWFKLNQLNKDQVIIISGEDTADGESNEDKVFIMVGSNNKVVSGWQTASEPDKAYSNDVLVSGRWYHAVLTWSLTNNAVRLYMDSMVQSSGDVFTNDNKTNWSDLLVLGRSMPSSVNNNFFIGLIDDVRVYSRVLTTQEISDIYSGKQIDDSGLTMSWNLNEGSGSMAYDSSTSGFDGTIYGATFSEDVSSSACIVLNAGYRMLNESYISISSPSNVTMTPAIGGTTGGTGNGNSTWTVITDSPAGYQISVKASTSPALQTGSYSFADYTEASSGTPDYSWSIAATDSEFGFSPEGDHVIGKFLDNGVDSCGVGSLNTTDTCWYGFSTSNEIIVSSSSANHPSGTETSVKFRAQSGASHIQEDGNYNATIVVTAVAL